VEGITNARVDVRALRLVLDGNRDKEMIQDCINAILFIMLRPEGVVDDVPMVQGCKERG
jgi:hypothetical protein